jgi:hypothetical protein
MKTSVTLFSPDRELFGGRIHHMTKPNMMCLTDLQRIYEEVRLERGWKERKIKQILNHKESPTNTERLYYALKERGLIKVDFPTFIEECDNKTLIKVLKEMQLYSTKGRGHNRKTYCFPDIFVLVSLELNPEFYGKTVVWLTDSLIVRRIYAGDNNNLLKNRMFYKWGQLPQEIYMGINMELNYVVFGKHYKNIRNDASIEELTEMENLQYALSTMIEDDYIKTVPELFHAINKRHQKKRGFVRIDENKLENKVNTCLRIM